MQVITLGAGPHPDFSVSAALVTVAGVAIDAAARQTDQQEIIDIRLVDGVAQEGGSGYQLASVRIPPRRYVETEPDPAEGEEATGSREPAALDPHHVAVTIWPTV
ncbi:hypothetical protein FIU88_05765 [Halomonas sp. THAF12]|uniref:hypothetical protein n=1 Tax=Halomonas sp. THAF12 TaxID=2587849 RepID=UPI00126841E4|nr:hypothetical protein [Halomonas sp. THAF12]QFT84486.1 hypothetical protein FIU88_05765 [Halomonas sp. THAF12]